MMKKYSNAYEKIEKYRSRRNRGITKFIAATKCIKDPFDPEYLRYNSFSLYINLLILATVSSTILTIFQRQYSFIPYTLVMCVLSIIAGYAVRKKRMPTGHFHGMVFCLELFLTFLGPLLYLSSGGIQSSTTIWLFLILIYTTIMFEGGIQILFFILQLALYFLAVLADYFGIIPVLGQLSKTSWYASLFVSVTVVSICMGVFILSQINEYKIQSAILFEELEELEQQRAQSEELMAQYEEQKEIAEKALKTQSEFLKNMSHEVRTPLNSIIGMADVISRIDNVNEIHALTGNIKNAANGLSTIISDVLEYSSSGDVDIKVNKVVYPVELLFNSFRNMCVPQLEAKGIGYNIERERLPEFLLGDITRIQQILFNLLNNAVKYTNSGKVTYKVQYSFSNDELILIVSDTGIGIKEEDMRKIFSAFERIEEADKKGTGGIGLGLSLTKKIVDAMNGAITCQSTFGEGTTFVVRIPQQVAENPGRINGEKEKTVSYDFSGKNVLCVDNTQANHFGIDKLLINTGAQLYHEFSTKDFLNYPDDRLNGIDLFVLDYQLQGIDAVELLAHLRERGITSSAICTVSVSDAESKQRALMKGFSAVIEKPFEEEKALEIISKVI